MSSAEGLIPDPDGRRITWPSWAESLLADDDPTVRMRAALLIHRAVSREGVPLPTWWDAEPPLALFDHAPRPEPAPDPSR